MKSLESGDTVVRGGVLLEEDESIESEVEALFVNEQIIEVVLKFNEISLNEDGVLEEIEHSHTSVIPALVDEGGNLRLSGWNTEFKIGDDVNIEDLPDDLLNLISGYSNIIKDEESWKILHYIPESVTKGEKLIVYVPDLSGIQPYVQVLNDNNIAVADAIVELGDFSATTDEFGVANFPDIFVGDDDHVEIKVSHDEYPPIVHVVDFNEQLNEENLKGLVETTPLRGAMGDTTQIPEQICIDKVWIENNIGKIACVTPSTADILVERGWGTLL